MKSFFVFFSVLCVSLGYSSFADASNLRVHLVQLFSNPDLYEGKKISVDGYICETEKGFGLFLSRPDCAELNYANGIRLIFPDSDKCGFKMLKNPSMGNINGKFRSYSEFIQTDASFPWGEIAVKYHASSGIKPKQRYYGKKCRS